MDLKVSKGVYLICTVFYSIIKYQSFWNHYMSGSQEDKFIFLNFQIDKKIVLTLDLKEIIWFIENK